MKNPTLLVLVAAILGIMLLPVSQGAKMASIVLLLVLLLYLKRGYLLVALGSRALNAKDPDEAKAWRLYAQGWKAGLPSHYTVMLGNLFVQRGDAAVALEIYDSVIGKEQRRRQGGDATITGAARVGRSMALWVLGEKKQAIDELVSLRAEGRLDKNIVVNLGNYLLATGRVEEAGTLINEASEHVPESLGMTDNRGHYLYLTGAYGEADVLYAKLLGESSPKFPEAYVHAAQVAVALEDAPRAIKLLREALGRPFYQTSTITKAEVERMLLHLLDPDANEEDLEDRELISVLYEDDLFEEHAPNTDIDDEDELDPNIELDPEDYEDGDDPEVEVDFDEDDELESALFADEYEDDEEEADTKK